MAFPIISKLHKVSSEIPCHRNTANGAGKDRPVGHYPADGIHKAARPGRDPKPLGEFLPVWDTDACIQCGVCSLVCPQAALRMKVFGAEHLAHAPETFKSTSALEPEWAEDLLNFTLQVHPDQCTSCNHCVDSCPVSALRLESRSTIGDRERGHWQYFEKLPLVDRSRIDTGRLSQQQLQQPLFEFPATDLGCGEAPYLKLLTQLFGDRLLIANATGSSSIVGGALATLPWSKNAEGRGPAWSNSLYEDNAEFGLGFRMAQDFRYRKAIAILGELQGELPVPLVRHLVGGIPRTESALRRQRQLVEQLQDHLKKIGTEQALELSEVSEALVPKSIWLVGGDGWAYDIGFGGLDHTLATGADVNILVLDNEVYSNTGGQMSKATPTGATAQFASKGKVGRKKDLARMAMTYGNVYVATVSLHADPKQVLKVLLEAASYPGPSLVLAYCHSPAHGIDITRPAQYHKAAVASGQWPLFRFDPRKERPMQLDSFSPSLPLESYFKMEGRFAALCGQGADQAALRQELQERVFQRYRNYQVLAGNIDIPDHGPGPGQSAEKALGDPRHVIWN